MACTVWTVVSWHDTPRRPNRLKHDSRLGTMPQRSAAEGLLPSVLQPFMHEWRPLLGRPIHLFAKASQSIQVHLRRDEMRTVRSLPDTFQYPAGFILAIDMRSSVEL
jgi:hypothetical protein